jgi:hypothetical protein
MAPLCSHCVVLIQIQGKLCFSIFCSVSLHSDLVVQQMLVVLSILCLLLVASYDEACRTPNPCRCLSVRKTTSKISVTTKTLAMSRAVNTAWRFLCLIPHSTMTAAMNISQLVNRQNQLRTEIYFNTDMQCCYN